MRRNPAKCAFGVAGGKFLGIMLTSRGIEANPDKCEAVLKMSSPNTLKDIQRLLGRLTALSRFIPKLAERVRPIVKRMKKDAPCKWDAEYDQAFAKVKEILMNPPVMNHPTSGHELQVYLGVSDTTISAILMQEKPSLKLIYFVIRTLQDMETRYHQVEKVALALLHAARRLRQYFQGHQVVVQTNHLVAKVLRKPDLAGRMVSWAVELSEFGL